MRRLLFSFIASSTLVLSAPRAHAQDVSAQVEALFAEGKKLEREGNMAAACPKFLASYNLEHRIGTLLNLADCYEKTGQLASAWARFVEAKTLATRANQPERADFARDHAAALEPRLSSLTVRVPHASPDLAVRRDGIVVEPAVYGVSVYVDPGDHKIEASAQGKIPWSGSVHVGAEKDAASIEVPELKDAPKTLVEHQAVTPETPSEKHGLSGRGVAGIVTAGVGVAGLGAGLVFGLLALSKNGDSSAYCNIGGVKDNCLQQGVDLRHDAVVFGNVSTVLFAVSSAVVIAGVVIWVTAPSGHPRAAVGFDGRTLSLSGVF